MRGLETDLETAETYICTYCMIGTSAKGTM